MSHKLHCEHWFMSHSLCTKQFGCQEASMQPPDIHKFTINKKAKMNQTMNETIINCIFVFMKKMGIPVNTAVSLTPGTNQGREDRLDQRTDS